jgi:pimeloyl-ACP methyl ester carboxylesterase
MADVVLVHGAWHGGWCWRAVARGLRARGHEVYTPTLTGLGERAHLLRRTTGLATHIRDITACVEAEQLTDAVLIGHSYGAVVAVNAGVAASDRVSRVMVVDGFLPRRGEIAMEMLPVAAAAHYRAAAQGAGDGRLIPPRPLANLGVTDEELIALVTPRLTPHPLKTYLDRSPSGVADLPAAGHYVLCSGWATPFGTFAARAADSGWQVAEVPADHEVMLTAPDLLIDALLGAIDE